MMSSCPICRDAFRSGAEVRWHVHHEHQRLTEDEALKLQVSRAASAQLDWQALARFAKVDENPCLSLLLATVPAVHGGHLEGIDRHWLDHLVAKAHEDMANAVHPDLLVMMSRRLDKAVAEAAHGPYDRGLALYVSPREMGIFRLPVAPRPRVVLGRRFAVRDMVGSLLHFPPYRVLVLGGSHPRLLEGWGNHLLEVGREPLSEGDVQVAPAHWHLLEAHHRALVTEADVMVAERAGLRGDRPLIVVGPPRLLAAWRRFTSCPCPVVAMVRGHHPGLSPRVIGQSTGPLVASWRRGAEDVEASCLRHAQRVGLMKWGISPTWYALSEGQATDLWVAKTFVAPNPGADPDLGQGRRQLLPRSEDLVEEMIRMALSNGARPHLVDEQLLGQREPVGAQLAIDLAPAPPSPAYHLSPARA